MAFDAGAAVGRLKLDTTDWDGKIDQSQKDVGGLEKGFNFLKIGAAAAGAAIVAGLSASLIKANEFQKELSNVSTLIDGGMSIGVLSARLQSFDSSLGSSTELTKALYQAISAGADPAGQAFDVVADSAKFARAALTDTATAVDVITTAMNAYGAETISSQRASDIFFTTIKQGKINGEQLSAVIGQSIPLFSSAGIKLEELSAGMAAMTKMGVSASQSTTQLNAIVSSFLKPSGEMVALLSEMGYESGAALLQSEGLAGALTFLENATAGNAAEMARLVPNIEAVRGIMSLTGQGGREFTSILKAMEGATGATEEAFKKQEFTVENLKVSLDNLLVTIGTNLFPAFKAATGAAIAFLDGIKSIVAVPLSRKIEEEQVALNGLVLRLGTANIAEDDRRRTLEEIEKINPQVAARIREEGDDLNSLKNILSDVNREYLNKILMAEREEHLAKIVKNGIKELNTERRAEAALTSFLNERAKELNITNDLLGKSHKEQIEIVAEAAANYKTVERSAAQYNEALIMGSLRLQEYEDAQRKTNNATTQMADFQAESAEIAERLGLVTQTTTAAFNAQTPAIQNNITNLDEYKGKLEEVRGVLDDYSTTSLERTRQTYEEQQAIINESFEVGLITDQEQKALLLENERMYYEQQQEIIANGIGQGLGVVTQGIQAISDIINSAYQTQTNQIQAEYNRRQTALKKQLTDGKITQEQFNKESAKLKQEQADKEYEITKQQFETQKAFSIINIWLSAAQAIVSFWAAFAGMGIPGIVLAAVMSGVVTGVAIAQTVVVATQQPPPKPAFEQGGMASGTVRVNESGGEIITLPDGSQVIPNDISEQIAESVGERGGGSQRPVMIQLQLDGRVLNEILFDYQRAVQIQ